MNKKRLISVLALALAVLVGTSAFALDFASYDCCDEHDYLYNAHHACCLDCELKEFDTLSGAFKYLSLGYNVRATAGAEEVYLVYPSGVVANINDIVLSAGQVELVELFLFAVLEASNEEDTMDVRFGRCCGAMTLVRGIAYTIRTSHQVRQQTNFAAPVYFTCHVSVNTYRTDVVDLCTGRIVTRGIRYETGNAVHSLNWCPGR